MTKKPRAQAGAKSNGRTGGMKKSPVTLSISDDLIEQVEEAVRTMGGTGKSQFFEMGARLLLQSDVYRKLSHGHSETSSVPALRPRSASSSAFDFLPVRTGASDTPESRLPRRRNS